MKKLLTLFSMLLISFHVSAGMVVIGNPTGVDSLDKKFVKKLFMGKKSKLPNGAKARIIELNNGSEGRIAFHALATGRSEAQLGSTWSRLVFTGKAEAPTQVADYSAVIAEVSADANAIGYVDDSTVTSGVKILLSY